LNLPAGGQMHVAGCRLSDATVISTCCDSSERLVCKGGMESLGIAIDQSLLSARAWAYLGRDDLPGLATDLYFSISADMTAVFRARVLAMFNQASTKPALAEAEPARKLLESLALSTVLDLLEASSSVTAVVPRASTRGYIVNRSIEFMEAHVSQPILIGDLCQAMGVCSRTLRYSFEDVAGVSPLQYLLAIRLNGVRRALMGRDRVGTIEEVALRWGFWHMGRFAYHYRRRFAERPSDTHCQAVKLLSARRRPRSGSNRPSLSAGNYLQCASLLTREPMQPITSQKSK
jgi:AraC family ethanolamine operon transcriptional activator